MAARVANARIVVGVDASSESLRALNWAVREAALLGATVEVVHAWSVPMVVYPEGQLLEKEPFHDLGQRTLDTAMASLARPGTPNVQVVPRLVEMAPVEALLDAAADADLLAIGNRGLVALTELLVHSVSLDLTKRSRCPVAVVPAHAIPDRYRNRIVAGVDGSPASADALRWAVSEAVRRRAELSVIITYHRHQLESPIGPPGVVDHDADAEGQPGPGRPDGRAGVGRRPRPAAFGEGGGRTGRRRSHARRCGRRRRSRRCRVPWARRRSRSPTGFREPVLRPPFVLPGRRGSASVKASRRRHTHRTCRLNPSRYAGRGRRASDGREVTLDPSRGRHWS